MKETFVPLVMNLSPFYPILYKEAVLDQPQEIYSYLPFYLFP